MTKEAQRIAIAEVCGWEWWTHAEGAPKLSKARDEDERKYWLDNRCFVTTRPENAQIHANQEHRIPNYCYDLNAIHEAEKMLTTSTQRYDYLANLDEVIKHPLSEGMAFANTHATAEQRAEAFLRTIGKWVEE